MDTSECLNCKQPIYHGPRTKKDKNDTSADVVVWRHVDTESNACRQTRAEPIMERTP